MSEQIIPGKCPACFGKRDDCEKCHGVGTVAFTIPDWPAWTRLCPDCGWTNGMRFIQPHETPPVRGALVKDYGNHCLECRRDGHMIWEPVE